MVTVRRIKFDEIDLYKQVRLVSLKDAPYAFETTYDSAVRRSDEVWRERVESGAEGTDGATFLAFSGELPIGIAALFRIKDRVNVGELMQVWVSPEYRGTTVTRDLMDTIFKWAGENNFHKVIAGVTKANVKALKFYVKYGFSALEETAEGVYLAKEVE